MATPSFLAIRLFIAGNTLTQEKELGEVEEVVILNVQARQSTHNIVKLNMTQDQTQTNKNHKNTTMLLSQKIIFVFTQTIRRAGWSGPVQFHNIECGKFLEKILKN